MSNQIAKSSHHIWP